MKGFSKKFIAVTLGVALALAVFPPNEACAEDKTKKTAAEEQAFYNPDISAALGRLLKV